MLIRYTESTSNSRVKMSYINDVSPCKNLNEIYNFKLTLKLINSNQIFQYLKVELQKTKLLI